MDQYLDIIYKESRLRKRLKSARKRKERAGFVIKHCMVSTRNFACCGKTWTLFSLCVIEEPNFIHIHPEKNIYDDLLWDAFTWNILLHCVCPPEILSMSLLENRLWSSGLYVPSSNLILHSSWGIIIILISLNPLPANICFNLLNTLLKLTIWRR